MSRTSTSLGTYGPDTQGAPHYAPGLGPWGVCDRCGYKFRHKALRREWTGLWVDAGCWDPRPPDMTPPAYPKPEPPNIFIDVPEPY